MRRHYVHAFTEDPDGFPVNHRCIGDFAASTDRALEVAEAHNLATHEVVTISNSEGRVFFRIDADGEANTPGN